MLAELPHTLYPFFLIRFKKDWPSILPKKSIFEEDGIFILLYMEIYLARHIVGFPPGDLKIVKSSAFITYGFDVNIYL